MRQPVLSWKQEISAQSFLLLLAVLFYSSSSPTNLSLAMARACQWQLERSFCHHSFPSLSPPLPLSLFISSMHINQACKQAWLATVTILQSGSIHPHPLLREIKGAQPELSSPSPWRVQMKSRLFTLSKERVEVNVGDQHRLHLCAPALVFFAFSKDRAG